ncbi:MAG: malectin, partial [Gammaproteobacteria bacterium]|nr:malectin [Gammaproteobacteria bacterium]
MIRKKLTCVVVAVSCMMISACGSERTEAENAATDLVWAVNIGGPAYVGIDGTRYEAEGSVRGGTVGKLDIVKGSQDAFLYEGYREGDVEVARAIADG